MEKEKKQELEQEQEKGKELPPDFKKMYPDMVVNKTFDTKPEITVFKLVDTKTRKEFVLKIFHDTSPNPKEGSGKIPRDKEYDSVVQAQTKTQRVAKVLKPIDIPKNFGILYEYAGVSLEQLQKEKSPFSGYKPTAEEEKKCMLFGATAQDALEIMTQVAEGCLALFDLKMIHSDIKPANIVFDKKTGVAKIIDLGESFTLPAILHPSKTFDVVKHNELMVGYTFRYLPPEICQEQINKTADPKKIYSALDVYCFGMTFYQFLLNKSDGVIAGETKSMKLSQDTYQRFNEKVREIKLLNDPKGEIGGKLVELLLACLEYEPRKRPSFAAIYEILLEMKKTSGTFKENQQKMLNMPLTAIPLDIKDMKEDPEEELSFSDRGIENPISAYGAFLIAQRINENVYLKKLIITGCFLNDAAGELILKSLINHPSISTLSLEKNEITTKCSVYLCHALKYNKSLEVIKFDSNNFDDSTVKLIAEGIEEGGSSIELISLNNIKITNEGVKHLFEAYYHKRNAAQNNIKSISLTHNGITKDSIESIVKEMHEFPLSRLYLDHNKLEKEGITRIVKTLVKYLAENPTEADSIGRVELITNGVTKEDREALTKEVPKEYQHKFAI